MGLAAVATLLYTQGSVKILIVMYSINVFLTFTLSQLGMVRHWWTSRGHDTKGHWRRRLFIAALGTLVTGGILVVTAIIKFTQGGWVTLAVTGAFVGICVMVRRHYQQVRGVLKSLDDVLTDLPFPTREEAPGLGAGASSRRFVTRAREGGGRSSVDQSPSSWRRRTAASSRKGSSWVARRAQKIARFGSPVRWAIRAWRA